MSESTAVAVAPLSSGAPPAPKVIPLTDIEKLELDRQRLEKELKELQKDLEDTLQMNDDMVNDLKNKDISLKEQEEYLKLLSQKNAAELQQLDTEHVCLSEKYNHDIEAAERNEMRQKMHRERFIKYEQENEELMMALQELAETTANQGFEHAKSIHEMNRNMGDFRKSLEDKLRENLKTIEETYQSQAFLSLTEREKVEIFENTKLKDEVILQGVGLANLSLRLKKQEYGTAQCKKEQQALNRKAHLLRNQLNDLQLTKMSRNRMRAELSSQLQVLRTSDADRMLRLGTMAPIEEIQAALRKSLAQIQHEERLRAMWLQREDMVHDLNRELQPVSINEKKGYFSSSTFRFVAGPETEGVGRAGTATIKQGEQDGSSMLPNSAPGNAMSTAASNATGNSGIGEGVKISVLLDATAQDPTLALALAPLKGQESMCITRPEQLPGASGGGEDSVNIVGWIVQRLLHIWGSTEIAPLIDEQEQSLVTDVSFLARGIPKAEPDHFGENENDQYRSLDLGDSLSQLEGADSRPPTQMASSSLPLTAESSVSASASAIASASAPQNEDSRPQTATENSGRDEGDSQSLPQQWDSSQAELLLALDEQFEDSYHPDFAPAPSPRESREEIERLWDEAFSLPGVSTDDGDGGLERAQWFSRVAPPKRLPGGITGAAVEPELFTYDSIRPAKVSYIVGPPVAIGSGGNSEVLPNSAPGLKKSHSLLSQSLSLSSSGSLSGKGLAAALLNVSASQESLKTPGGGGYAGNKGGGAKLNPVRRKNSLRATENLIFSTSGTAIQRVKSAPALEERGGLALSGGPLRRLKLNPSTSAIKQNR